MKTLTVKIPLPGRQFLVVASSVLISLLFVWAMANGATTIDTASVGIGTSTPGAALGVKGEGIFEGFVHADYYISTSTSHASGFGTSSPGTEFSVAGGGLFEGGLVASYLNATSTVDNVFGGVLEVTEAATNTFTGGITAGTGGLASTGGLRVDTGEAYFDENVGIATTSPTSDLAVGGGAATTTLFLAGSSTAGGQIIIASSDGSACISIIADRNGNDIGDVAMDVTTLLSANVIACPIAQ